MLIGQEGESACSPKSEQKSDVLKRTCDGVWKEGTVGGGGGGGGATYVWKVENGRAIPLIVAAGGGGSAVKPSNDEGRYALGMTVTDERLRPVNGNTPPGKFSGGGGGWNETALVNSDPRTGFSATEGGRGGKSCDDRVWSNYGGFGGGGGPCSSGGGGGGYRGGDAPNHTHHLRDGNGGNSYISSLRVGNEHLAELGGTGAGKPNGEVVIKYIETRCPCEGIHICSPNPDFPSGEWDDVG